MHTQTFLCFGARPGAGNPALVVRPDASDPDDLDPDLRQRFARARDTTCVFLDEGGDGIMQLDYWYPHTRSPLCVHATLAAAAVLYAHRPGAAAIAVRTAMRGQLLELVREGDAYFVRLQGQPAPAADLGIDAVAALLRAPAAVVAAPPRTASVGSPKLLVELADAAALAALAPDLDGIATWGRARGVNGIYAYCRRGDGTYEGRNFNHLDPALEDSATGVAAGALSALLGHGLDVRQGRATGRDCLIRTRVDGERIRVGGAVEAA